MNGFDEIICDALAINRKQLRDDLGPDDVRTWDSLTHLSLVLALEEAYDIEIDVDDFNEMTTIGGIKKVLAHYGVEI